MSRLLYPLCALGSAIVAAGTFYVFSGPTAPDRMAQNGVLARSVILAGVHGAPGDGNTALSTSIRTLLVNARVPIVETPNRCTVSVSAEVSAMAKGTTEEISIIWQVHDSDGRTLGEVAQINEIPAGTLSATWGAEADNAARGAGAGVMEIMRRKTAGCA